MTELNTESFRNCFAGRRALVSLALVATIGLAATSIASEGGDREARVAGSEI